LTTDTANVLVGEAWRDVLEAGVRGRICGFIEELLDEELAAALGRGRYARARERLPRAAGESAIGGEVVLPVGGHRNGHRDRQVMGTFGAMTVSVPRARVEAADGKTSEWHSKTLPAYQRRTKEIDGVIAGSYLAGTNTRRVGRALAALFRGSVSKDTVSRTWRKIKGDWDAWNARDLSKEEMVPDPRRHGGARSH
jgi:putative transposase